jgi:hypothetical protein
MASKFIEKNVCFWITGINTGIAASYVKNTEIPVLRF